MIQEERKGWLGRRNGWEGSIGDPLSEQDKRKDEDKDDRRKGKERKGERWSKGGGESMREMRKKETKLKLAWGHRRTEVEGRTGR